MLNAELRLKMLDARMRELEAQGLKVRLPENVARGALGERLIKGNQAISDIIEQARKNWADQMTWLFNNAWNKNYSDVTRAKPKYSIKGDIKR